ncbi:MAG: hypothetical protein ABRQ23_05255 [Syntrophomonadaceae bacterium]
MQLFFGKSLPEDGSSIRQFVFPGSDPKKVLPELAGFFPFSAAVKVIVVFEQAIRQVEGQDCTGHMNKKPSREIDEDSQYDWYFKNVHQLVLSFQRSKFQVLFRL